MFPALGSGCLKQKGQDSYYLWSSFSGGTSPVTLLYYEVMNSKAHADAIPWKTEFWPQQWRIAISWLAVFFMLQAFVPILFFIKGPIIAGQMGAMFQIYNGANSFSKSWLYAVGPNFGILGKKGNSRIKKSCK